MAEKEKAAVAVETTATNAQEASPASTIDDITKEKILQYAKKYQELLLLGDEIEERTNHVVGFCQESMVVYGVEVLEEILSPILFSVNDVEYQDHVLRHLRFGYYYRDGEFYGRLGE